MTHNPATDGFLPEVLPKVQRTRRFLDERAREDVVVAVDGGVGLHNAESLCRAGAGWPVAGSGVFRSPDGPAKAFLDLLAAGQAGAPVTES